MIVALSTAGPIRVALPPLPRAFVGPPRRFRAAARPVPFDDGTVAVVRGRRVSFKGDVDGFDRVQVKAVGRDGTVLIQRACVGGPRWSFEDRIVHGRKETPVSAFGRPAELTDYVDAHHYLAAFKRAGEEDAPPLFLPPTLLIVDGSRKRIVGKGDPVAWAPGREVVAKVTVADDDARTFVFEGGRTYHLGDLAYALRLPNGESLFRDENGGLFRWSHGALHPWVRLPGDWKPIAASSVGLLVQQGDGWQAGLLRGRTLTPIRSALSEKVLGLTWLETPKVGKDGSFRVYASNRRDRTMEVEFRPDPHAGAGR